MPTMGALHEGHLSLMRSAKAECDLVAASIFVNPLQFGPKEDLSRYPRSEERDFELAERAGVDHMFCPAPEEIIRGQRTTVQVSGVSEMYEGAFRPGHFDGVATIVAKLFNIVQPSKAYFGTKDLQQCAVLKRMVEDLDFRIEMNFLPTVREADGLALSSRNTYLSAEERSLAPAIYRTLCRIAETSIGDHSLGLDDPIEKAIEELQGIGFSVDYLDAVNWNEMRSTRIVDDSTWLVVAARLGKTRLIDAKKITAS